MPEPPPERGGARGPRLAQPPGRRARGLGQHAEVLPARPGAATRHTSHGRGVRDPGAGHRGARHRLPRHPARGERRPPAAGGVLGRADPGGGAGLPPVPRPGGRAAPPTPPARSARHGHPRGCPRPSASRTSSGCSRRPRGRHARRRCATGPCSRSSTAPARGSPRRSASTSTTSTRTKGSVRLFGKGSKERIVPLGSYAAHGARRVPRPGPPGLRRARGRGRRRCSSTSGAAGSPASAPGRCCGPPPSGPSSRRPPVAAHPAPLVRHPPARRRRRRPGRAGAARARLGDHDPDLHAGDRAATAGGLCTEPPPGALIGSCRSARG